MKKNYNKFRYLSLTVANALINCEFLKIETNKVKSQKKILSL